MVDIVLKNLCFEQSGRMTLEDLIIVPVFIFNLWPDRFLALATVSALFTFS